MDPHQDLRERWLPTGDAVQRALALLEAEPDADVAVIPMYQPGKTYGIWTVGQEVCTVSGRAFLAVDSFERRGDLPDYGWARDAASKFARATMGDLPGTTAWAVVRRDGTAVVFEDIL